MASASARKQGHLELGKKKLEEFRKKKAAKKAAPGGQLQSTGTSQLENISETNTNLKDEAASGGNFANNSRTAMMHESRTKSSESTDSLNNLSASLTDRNSENSVLQRNSSDESVKKASSLHNKSAFSELADGYSDHQREENDLSHMKDSNIISADGFPSDQFGVGRKPSGDHMHAKPSVSPMSAPSEKPENHSAQNSRRLPNTLLKASEFYEVEAVEQPNNRSSADKINMENINKGGKIADAINRHLNFDGSHRRLPGPSSTSFSPGFGPSSNYTPIPSSGYGTSSIRSRPSFLDSLGVARVSSTSNISHGEPEKHDPTTSFDSSKNDIPEIKLLASLQQPSVDPITKKQSVDMKKMEFPSANESSLSTSSVNDGYQQKEGVKDDSIQGDTFLHREKDVDFAALEQHIEDLTKEKFSMQRALETAQTLAKSLAAENSSLTDCFNEQGKVVQQLKSDMERLQEELKSQLLVLESMKLEYTNAQLECNAADERAKILASEVITLEEKALRLRSNELKLEKQLDETNSVIASYKRKFSLLEKERQDLQLTSDALLEEKKLLQSKLRKASTDGKSKDNVVTSTKIDASTSTEDLASETSNCAEMEIGDQGMTLNSNNNSTQGSSDILSTNTYLPSFLPEDRGPDLADASSGLPQDQLRIVDNIKSLISELAVEKEELVQALRIESSNCSKLKELNKDLSQKLEIQTQRLELLTSQRLASENILTKPIDTRNSNDTTEYADEGDEVVERVLGWIMKLFPGGPAKRRTSKLL